MAPTVTVSVVSVVSVMSMVPMMPVVLRRSVELAAAWRTVILTAARRTVVLRLPVSPRRVVLLVAVTGTTATAQQPAQHSTACAAMVAPMPVLVAVLILVLDGVGGDGAGDTA